jgi:hypothetical protein
VNGPLHVTPSRPPARCACRRSVVATLAETLDCPACWYEEPGTGWARVWPPRVRDVKTARQTAGAS